MLDSNPLDTILHIIASTLLGKVYFLSWIGQKRAKMASFRRFGLLYIWIVYSAYSHLWSLLVMQNLLRLSPEKVFCIEAVPVKWQPHEVGKSQKKKLGISSNSCQELFLSSYTLCFRQNLTKICTKTLGKVYFFISVISCRFILWIDSVKNGRAKFENIRANVSPY